MEKCYACLPLENCQAWPRRPFFGAGTVLCVWTWRAANTNLCLCLACLHVPLGKREGVTRSTCISFFCLAPFVSVLEWHERFAVSVQIVKIAFRCRFQHVAERQTLYLRRRGTGCVRRRETLKFEPWSASPVTHGVPGKRRIEPMWYVFEIKVAGKPRRQNPF